MLQLAGKRQSRRNKVEGESWALVKFIDDGIWHVCPPSRLRRVSSRTEVKWPPNRKWYSVKVYANGFTNTGKILVKDLKKSISFSYLNIRISVCNWVTKNAINICTCEELKKKCAQEAMTAARNMLLKSISHNAESTDEKTESNNENSKGITGEIKSRTDNLVNAHEVLIKDQDCIPQDCYDTDNTVNIWTCEELKEKYAPEAMTPARNMLLKSVSHNAESTDEKTESNTENSKGSNGEIRSSTDSLVNAHEVSNKDYDCIPQDCYDVDDTFGDTDYIPESDKSEEQGSNEINTHNIDYKTQIVYPAGMTTKKHFCPFCFKLQTKIARHLEYKHKDVDAVQKIIALPKKSKSRLNAISALRNKGDYLYNSEIKYNLGYIIPVRQPQNFRKREAMHYKVCGNCKGLYSKLTLASHYRKCKSGRKIGKKDVMLNSRLNDFMHSKNNSVMKNRILPKMRNDKINDLVRSQTLIIVFGNRLTSKYRSPHFENMIRSRLRCVAKFFLHIKNLKPELNNLEEVFKPCFYDNIVEAINKMAGLNETSGKYRAPSTAFNIGSYLKKIAFYLVSETIKAGDKNRQEEIRDLVTLMEEGFPYDVYKTVSENQVEMKIKKKIELPTERDIIKLKKFLDKHCKLYAQKLNNEYCFSYWKELLSLLLVSLLLFNRRRVGEMERVKIQDYSRYETSDTDASTYVRFLIRGKLARGVPVMINREKLTYLELILKFREKAGVSSSNPYLFGIPSDDNFEHLSATRLLYKYARECGAENPKTLRGTELRKQFATKCGTMDLDQSEIKDVANYMGHHEQIHLNHYRMPDATRDIMRMSTLLEQAQGNTNIEEVNNNTFSKFNNSVDKNEFEVEDNSQSPNLHRRSWNDEEKNAIAREAENFIENFEIPSLQYCKALTETVVTLKERSPAQVKAYIANCIKKEKCKFLTPNKSVSRKVVKHFWTSPEKKEVMKYFGNLMNDEIVPSLKMCDLVIKKSSMLKNRTPEMLKAYVNNCLKRSFR